MKHQNPAVNSIRLTAAGQSLRRLLRGEIIPTPLSRRKGLIQKYYEIWRFFASYGVSAIRTCHLIASMRAVSSADMPSGAGSVRSA